MFHRGRHFQGKAKVHGVMLGASGGMRALSDGASAAGQAQGTSNEAQMIIEANGVGASYAIPNESFIAEMSLGVSGLRVIVDTDSSR